MVTCFATPATWRQHGKAWTEWLSLVGNGMVSASSSSWLEVAIDYLSFLRDSGCSGLVASQSLSGVACYFR